MISVSKKMAKILFVGQTPPPYGGQAIMQQMMLEGSYRDIKFYHVRMEFSKEMNEVGRFAFKKIFHLFSIIFKIIRMRFRHNLQILYYPPAGPNRIPMYRDMAILLCTRWLFKKTIFHFHASGISECYKELSSIEQLLFRLVYFHVDLSIRLSELTPQDGNLMKCKKEIIVPNGIADNCPEFTTRSQNGRPGLTILFVGILCESKGVLILLDACRRLKDAGVVFHLQLMGKFSSKSFEQIVQDFIENHGLKDKVDFLGVCSGSEKWQHFNMADIFCFPSFYTSEAFPVVLLEAMQFGLPVVTTRWRGIPSIVADGKSGFLVETRNSRDVAEKLTLLLCDKGVRNEMGKNGRQIYIQQLTIDKFCYNIEKAILAIL